VPTPAEILARSTTIAVVGASRFEEKPAYSVPRQLLLHGWRVVPVNPFAEEIWGERCYRRLQDIPFPVDLVDVFRPSDQATDVVRDAVTIHAGAVWLQQDITSPEGRRIATEAGLDYVEDLCIAVVRSVHQLSHH
jgi:uncharacterized protein